MSQRRGSSRRADRGSVRALACLGVLLAAAAALHAEAIPTHASWVDQVPVTGTSMTAARVDLRVQGADSVTNFTSMNSSTMTPGSSVAGALTVRNNGTIPVTYYATATATNADGKGLSAALVVKVTNGSATGSNPNRTCTGTVVPETATAFTSPFVASAASPRMLTAGTQEALCIEATLPSDTPTTLQSAATTVSFHFSADGVPASAWVDAVPVSGTSLGTATISTPTLNCGAEIANKQVVVNWAAMPGATGYRLFYGTGGSQSTLLSAGTTSYPFKYTSSSGPLSGTASVQAIYGSAAWTSATSNTRTYYVDDTTATCSA